MMMEVWRDRQANYTAAPQGRRERPRGRKDTSVRCSPGYLCLLLALLLLGLSGCRSAGVSGVVWEDTDADGHLGAMERPLAGVALSDGSSVVLTNAQGRYYLPDATPLTVVRLTVPSGYWPTDGAWFRRVPAAASSADFPLQARPGATPWRFVQVSDVHYVAPARPLIERFVAEVAALDPPPAFVISTGDLLNNVGTVTDPDLLRRRFAQYSAALSGLPVPLLHLPGNHDLPGYGGSLSPRDPLFGVRGFETLVGPAWYSLDYADVHLVMLLTTRRNPSTGAVHAGLPDECRDWLARDLALTPPDRPLLLFAHQPPTSWNTDLATLLAGRRVLGIFCGHQHRDKVYRLGDWTVYETGALSGGWWLGRGTEDTPRGYRLVSVGRAGVLSSDYHQAP